MHTLSEQHAAMSYLIPAHLEHLRAAGKSERTIAARRHLIARLHKDLPYGLAYAATEQLEAWLASPGWSRWTRKTYTNHVISFYRWATIHEHLDGDPTARLGRPKAPRCVPRPVTDEQLALALSCPEPLLTAVMLASLAGLRVDEVAHARREDITEAQLYIPVGKGGSPGSVPTHPDLWAHIRNRPDGYLVEGPRGPVDGHWITVLARKTFTQLDMRPRRTMHEFRHWYGTMIHRANGDARVTQECLRHENVSSTQIYTQVADGRLTAAVSSLRLPLPVRPEPVSTRLGPAAEAA